MLSEHISSKYTYTTPTRICTPLIVFRSFRSLATTFLYVPPVSNVVTSRNGMGIKNTQFRNFYPLEVVESYGTRALNLVCYKELARRKKKNQNIAGIRTHAHSLDGPVQLLPGYQVTLIELRLNHTFNIQLLLVFPVS